MYSLVNYSGIWCATYLEDYYSRYSVNRGNGTAPPSKPAIDMSGLLDTIPMLVDKSIAAEITEINMRLTWKTELPQLTLVAAMFVLAAVFWRSAPEQIPVHWDISGQVDRYSRRFEGLLLLPVLALGLYLLMLFLPRIDPRRSNYARFRNAYLTVRVVILVFIALIYGFILLWLGGIQLDPSVVVPAGVGVLLIVLGIPMSKIQPNWFVGIRTPWTLTSELLWRKTHRLGRWLFIFAGGLFLISSLAGGLGASIAIPWVGWIFLFAVVLFLVGYSYFIWRVDPQRVPNQGPE
jgi:uncharacterized membrane protein